MQNDLLHKVDIDWLLSFYGAVLTEKQLKISKLYYDEDCSLAEIAQIENVSRQSIHDTLHRVEKQLYDMETKLGFRKRMYAVENCLLKAQEIISKNECDQSACEWINKAIRILNDEEENHGL